jgi:type III pantothenate kinase
MNLIIDAGNSFFKIALFNSKKIVEEKREKISDWEKVFTKFIENHSIDKIIFSSVSVEPEILKSRLSVVAPTLQMNVHLKIPFNVSYKSKSTLGTDRLCGVIGALGIYGKSNLLVIDCGTCITYNFLQNGENFMGGSISPGIDIRFRALHNFTENLPLLSNTNQKPELVGNDTNSSIESGVLNGVLLEMEGVIEQYILNYGLLNVVLTGGNHTYFANNLKNTTFAHPNLVLIGLNDILEFNS